MTRENVSEICRHISDTILTLSYRHVWQPQAINQAREPRITTQIVEFWIADRDDAHHALRERLFKLIKRRFVVSEPVNATARSYGET